LNFKDRIKQKLNKERLYELPLLIAKVKSIATQNLKLVICPENTDANWLGIKNATLSMFPLNTFVIPQSFSNQIVSDKDLKSLLIHFKENKGEEVLLSGLPNYFFKIIDICNDLGIKVEVLFHGGLAELNQNSNKQDQMGSLFKAAKKHKISKLFVVKEGLDILFQNLTGIKTERITPGLSLPENLQIKKYEDEKIHIGIFGNNSFNKNRHNQVAAAAMVPNSVIHIIGENEFTYLLPNDRVISHKQLNRKKFLELLGSMDINLYCSYSESWGQVVLESLELNTPCISSNSSGIIKTVESKYKKLFIDQVDNPLVIYNAIVENLKSIKL
jgi:glycosyltransferase involved in cell wall biosynthesis|tara:strand:- start:694 stop:1680 length:987 start_codon:yes stop_codon:yes gene_type:complete